MPKDQNVSTILVIGSGPIVIGQAAEFDYAGTQGCIALKEEGYKVILVNNNPATIMTDSTFADRIYFEPLTVDVLEKIIQKERPDGLLATLGGQTGLNLAFQLHAAGILSKYGVKMLGSSIESIKKGEDREAFRELMKELNEPVPESQIVHAVTEALEFANKIGFPIIVRPAYTLGGTGGGIAGSLEELSSLVAGGLQESAIGQCLVEKSIAGFKEIEYEVMRDKANTCITICNMENFDPVGIHTGDSIVVAPSQTLTDEEYQMLRRASIKIISALGIVGGCNIQFALDPNSKKYYLIEVNPRVSRSSALASKATGYPNARMAAKLSVGYTLAELINPVTGDTFASFEPTLDYVVVKFPKWPFDKFPTINRTLGTQMKATGEVMGIDRNFERALLKAVHSLEININDLKLPRLNGLSVTELLELLNQQSDERFFILLELLRQGVHMEALHEETKIDLFFLRYLKKLVSLEKEIESVSFESVSKEQLQLYKEKGFSDAYLAITWKVSEAELRSKRKHIGVIPAYKMVDTCAAEFEAKTNYYYSTYFGENEQTSSNKRKVLIIGSGPIRIGQGIEFDYCSVHGVYATKEENIETIMINNNPETVSTDFATADRLYFEPLTVEDILNVLEAEEMDEVIIQLGGQTAINLASELENYGVKILGTKSSTIDLLEDRQLFYELLDTLKIPRLKGNVVYNEEQLFETVKNIGYPVLVRPSFVIGGRGMEVMNTDEELSHYLNSGFAQFPFLVDEFYRGGEAEIDLVADGEKVLAPVVMEHIEQTGVHSGDSMSFLPAMTIPKQVQETMLQYAAEIVQKLNYKGLMNIQFIFKDEKVYVLEVNPRASRTVPIVSKMTGIPLVQIATKILLGKYILSNDDVRNNLMSIPFVCVKYPVFSNYALKGLDSKLSPEMRSTGEGICLGKNSEDALRKVFHKELKNIESGTIFVEAAVSEFEQLLQQSNITIQQISDSSQLNKEKALAYYNPGHLKNDKLLRETATKNRIMTFTEEESLKAFITALNCHSFNVHSIEDWHELLGEGVKAR
ncbi:carbamoyl phosphate synthase large subunit [Bacillus sp. 31A1R]|uniref:Carbamoyl phosphate synthase large chain n=1 Tax=Robertmurraya mangrovi TaxID=3098077 RepID=A0ABU5IT41_9BACI|nr:carbamoyl phosphate synthase large subunit [Bacillus sp. 31A1R]MDZ5470324.1 carbamoyl phosphate synthase large subunit [Bacillus sp. 31A1R]